jgi:SecD/SecF fusion protein
MQNKGGVIFITVVITLLCLYYLSFTFVSNSIQKQATEYATDASGTVDFTKKQQFLDSVWREPVYKFLGISYTYQQVKETELGLGLDLQGGMQVTLEIDPSDIIRGLAGRNADAEVERALDQAAQTVREDGGAFTSAFAAAMRDINPNRSMADIFATAANRGRFDFNTSDADILAEINREVEDAIDRSFNILRTRIDRFGTSQPNIQRLQGSGRIQIELPGVDNPERVRRLLQGVAKLEFWEVWDISEYAANLQEANNFLVAEEKARKAATPASPTPALTDEAEDQEKVASDSTETDLEKALSQDLEEDLLGSQVSPLLSLNRSQFAGLSYALKDTARINRILERPEVQSLMPSNLAFVWSINPTENSADGLLELIAIKKARNAEPPLAGDVITDARQSFDQNGRPAISMSMNANGAKKWRRITGENIGRRVAIVLDNYVLTAPNVQTEISGGNSEITGNFSIEEARDLANLLKAGALPAPTRIAEFTIVGPTLGKEAQAQGIFSMVSGLALVVLFMFLYYARGGAVAILALAFNIFFILGILAQLSAALTLPGIAGIVLTIGMSIDANVLIFERIREELRKGVKLLTAIKLGYEKAYSSIIDANVTTLLTAVILYSLGQGPVKGFAITLIIGIICSFFSAVFITRVVIEWMSRKGDATNLNFSFKWSQNMLTNTSFDFMSKRRKAYIGSGVIIAIGMILIVIQQGLNLGVDFTGGRSYVVSFPDAIPASEVKVALTSSFENAGTEVKTFGANNVLKITTSYLISDNSDEADEQVRDAMIAGLQSFTGLKFMEDDTRMGSGMFTILSSSKVLPSIADDIKSASRNSIILAMIAMFLYILVRFRTWQFGLGAVAAVIHDVLVVLSAFAIARAFGFAFEVDQVFIAAILTVVGYSINDTVIVFDRIRENLENTLSKNFEKIFNEAINETISRTIVTSATTLLVVLILLIFGGEVLRGFSFSIFVGILVGTYSSIFIAAPLVVDLTSKSLEKAQAKAAEAAANAPAKG